MNEKIQHLKIKNAKNIILRKYHFLDIVEIECSQGSEHSIFIDFKKFDIWNYENQPIATFPFHYNGIIDKKLFDLEYKKAYLFFIEKIKLLNEKYVWIPLSQNRFTFFVKVSLQKIFEHFNNTLFQNENLLIFIPNKYALAIHLGEYEWEILEKQI